MGIRHENEQATVVDNWGECGVNGLIPFHTRMRAKLVKESFVVFKYILNVKLKISHFYSKQISIHGSNSKQTQ